MSLLHLLAVTCITTVAWITWSLRSERRLATVPHYLTAALCVQIAACFVDINTYGAESRIFSTGQWLRHVTEYGFSAGAREAWLGLTLTTLLACWLSDKVHGADDYRGRKTWARFAALTALIVVPAYLVRLPLPVAGILYCTQIIVCLMATRSALSSWHPAGGYGAAAMLCMACFSFIHLNAFFAVLYIAGLGLLTGVEWTEIVEHRQAIAGVQAAMQQEKESILGFLRRVGEAISADFDLDALLRIIVQCACESIHANAGAIFLRDEASGDFRVRVIEGLFPPLGESALRHKSVAINPSRLTEALKAQHFADGESVIGEVAASRTTRCVTDVRSEAVIAPVYTEFLRNRALVAAPLIFEDEVLGVMAMLSSRGLSGFTPEQVSILESLTDQASFVINTARMYKELAEKERIEKELQIAREIQHLLLPQSCPALPGFDIAALCRSASEVGGDYFDFIPVNEECIGIVVADVSGKGVPGAFTMAMLRSLLRGEAVDTPSPAEVLRRVNRVIFDDLRGDMFVSVSYMVINTRTREARVSRAGHEPIYWWHPGNGGPQTIAPAGIAIGLDPGPDFDTALEEQTLRLGPGDLLLAYTDGLTEAMDSRREEYGHNRLQKVVTGGPNGGAEAIVERLEQDVRQFTGGLPLRDDITAVVVHSTEHGWAPLN